MPLATANLGLTGRISGLGPLPNAISIPLLGVIENMSRLVSLFTGQWADLKLEDMARKTKEFGYSGIELACWGDHFEVQKALNEPNYCKQKRDLLERHGLRCEAIS